MRRFAIGVADPWMRMQFFLRSDPDLGMTPLDARRRHSGCFRKRRRNFVQGNP
jgi:hypothetical protein